MVMMLPAEISEAPKPSDGALPPEDMELLEVMSPGRKSSLGRKLPLTWESLLGWLPFCGGLHAAKATGLTAHIAHATYPGRAEGDVGLRGAEIHAHPGAAAGDGDGAVGIEGLVVGIAAAPYGHIAAGDIDGEIIVCKIGICCVQAIVRADNADIA